MTFRQKYRYLSSLRFPVLDQTGIVSPFGVRIRLICPCKNSALFKAQAAASSVGCTLIQGEMKITINVRVNITENGPIYTVWPRPHHHLPGVEFYTGHGSTIKDAISDLYDAFPVHFDIEDEISVRSASLECSLRRPFEMVRSENIRTFVVC